MLPHSPVEQSPVGQPLTKEEFQWGYEETLRLAGKYAIAKNTSMAQWMDEVAEATVMENPALYLEKN